MDVIRVTRVGWKARRRLVADVTVPVVLARLSRSLYLDVAGELVWLGPPDSPLHCRAILAEPIPKLDDGAPVPARFDLSVAQEWRAPSPRGGAVSDVVGASRTLLRRLTGLGTPEGFGNLLVGLRLPFPLDRAVDDARAFLAACVAGDAPTAVALADRLLGLGPGLTPAGDDLVGGAFFARRVLVDGADPAPWRAAAETVRARAVERTHRIGAALLGDLLDGEGYAPLHDLSVAFAGADEAAALQAAARLVRLGHSSGWDLLTGMLGALGSLPER